MGIQRHLTLAGDVSQGHTAHLESLQLCIEQRWLYFASAAKGSSSLKAGFNI